MGSFFKPQDLKTTQSASTSALQPYAGAYKQLLNRGLDVSNTAYNPATNAGVAGFSDPQRAAFGLTQQNVGAYQPYLAAATGAASLGAAPSYSTVGNYMNPFDQYVTGSLLSDYDQMINRNRQMNMSDAARAGALTGDRRYVAQSIGQEGLDRTLASNLAQTRQAGYTQALGAAQADALRGLQATGVLSNLGGLAQQYGYNDVNAMLGIGGLQQGQQQKELDTATQNAIRQSAYPFETAQWAANYATGLGGAAGNRSTGQTIQPGPTPFTQVAGAGLAGLGMYLGAKDGGAIHGYAQGGQTPFFGGLTYVPQTKMQSRGLAPAQFVPPSKIDTGGMDKLLSNFTNAYGSMRKNKKEIGSWTNPDTGEVSRYYEPSNANKLGDWLGTQANNAWGGLSNLANNAYSGISSGLSGLFGAANGGVVRHHYRDGGLTPFDYYTTYVPDNNIDSPNLIEADPRLAAWTRQHNVSVPNADENKTTIIPMIDQNLVSPEEFYNSKVAEIHSPTPEPETRVVSSAPVPPNSETLTSASDEDVITPQYMMKAGLGDVKPPQKNSDESEGKSLFGINVSPDAANALVAAGLGMMASSSPFIGQAIGQGGMAGMNYYVNAKHQRAELEKERRKEAEQRLKDEVDLTLKRARTADLLKDKRKLQKTGEDAYGNEILSWVYESGKVEPFRGFSASDLASSTTGSTSPSSSSSPSTSSSVSNTAQSARAPNELEQITADMTPDDRIAYLSAVKKGNSEAQKKIADFYKSKNESKESIKNTVINLASIPQKYPGTFEHAIGPNVGAEYGEGWGDQIGNAVIATSRGIEKLKNYNNRFTTKEVLDDIKGTTNTLISKLRTIQGLTAKNTDSNRELQFLIDQAGSLTTASSAPEYYRKLTALNTRLKDAFGIDTGLEIPTLPDNFTSDMFTNEDLAKKYPGFIPTPKNN